MHQAFSPKAVAQAITFQLTTDTLSSSELEQLKQELHQVARLAHQFSQARNSAKRTLC